jgi:ParB family chromosome partitioning protein
MAVKRKKIHLESVEELLGAPVAKEGAIEIKIDQIYPFENHPFKVLDDDRMTELVQSIKLNGVVSPVIVRPDDEGTYEMISGHRRMHAAKLVGLTTIPAIIKEMTNDEAVILMVDANIQREEILPSEIAYSLKMKMDAMNRQGQRTDLTLGRDVPKWSHKEIGEEAGISGRQVKRYIRLTELVPELLDLVDDKKLGMMLVVDISFFDKELQHWLFEYIKDNGFFKPVQVEALKNASNIENVTQYTMIQLLNDALPEKKAVARCFFQKENLISIFRLIFPLFKERRSLLVCWKSGKRRKIWRDSMRFAYYKRSEAEQFSFIRIPKAMMTEEIFLLCPARQKFCMECCWIGWDAQSRTSG